MRRTSRPAAVPVLAMLLALVAAGCGSSAASTHSSSSSAASSPPTSSAAAPAHKITVAIKNFAYVPPTITVAPGTRITWVNHDSTAHTSTASGAFDTGSIDPGQSKSVTLSKPGTYRYICSFHPFMHGTIVVR